MSEIVRPRTTFADAVATVPGWIRPLRFNRGRGALGASTVCLVALAGIYLSELLIPAATLGSVVILLVLFAVWTLPGRMAVAVAAIAALSRLLPFLHGGSVPLESASEAATIGVVGLVGRVAAVYVAATREAAERADLLARVARIATSAESLKQILDRILREMAREGLRGGLIGLIDERGEIYPAAAEGDIDVAVWNSRLPLGQGIMGTAAAEGRPIVVRDLDAPDLPVRPVNRALGSNARMKSMVVVPLL